MSRILYIFRFDSGTKVDKICYDSNMQDEAPD